MPRIRSIAREIGQIAKEETKRSLTEGRRALPTAAGATSAPVFLNQLSQTVKTPEEFALLGFSTLGLSAMMAGSNLENAPRVNAARDRIVEPGFQARADLVSQKFEEDNFYNIPDEWSGGDKVNRYYEADTPEEYYRQEVKSQYMDNPVDFMSNPQEYIEDGLRDTQKEINKRVRSKLDLSEQLQYPKSSAHRRFRTLPRETFIETGEGLQNTFQRFNIDKVKQFGENIKDTDPLTVRKFVNNLKDEHSDTKAGHRIVNIGKNVNHIEFFEEGELLDTVLRPEKSGLVRKLEKSAILPETLENIATGFTESGNQFDAEEYVSEIKYKDTTLDETSQGQQLIDILDEKSDELDEVDHLAELADIDPQWRSFKKAKNFAYQGREIDRDELEKLVENEISGKKAEYTEEAVIQQSFRIIESIYSEITGETKDNYREEEIAALKAHKKFSTNRDAVEDILTENKGVYEQDKNQRWLEKAPVDEETLTEFDDREYVLDGERQYDVEARREELVDEMSELVEELEDISELEIESDEFESIDDFESYAQENEDPELGDDAETLYEEVFDEKVNEYHDIAAGSDSEFTDRIEVGLASPLETMMTGTHFSNSCLHVDKSNGWGAAGDAVDANKQTVYARDENDNVMGRALVTVTEDGALSDYSFYTNDGRVEGALDNYIDEYSQALGLERENQNKNVAVLEADDWYSGVR